MVGKTKGRRMRAPLCCYYVSVVRYLDCLDFGRLDCGVFTMKCLETWKPFVDLRKLFSEQDILNIRVQYAIRMYFHSHNETDMSLVLDYYTQVWSIATGNWSFVSHMETWKGWYRNIFGIILISLMCILFVCVLCNVCCVLWSSYCVLWTSLLCSLFCVCFSVLCNLCSVYTSS